MRKMFIAAALLTATVASAQLKKAPSATPMAAAPAGTQSLQVSGAQTQQPTEFKRISMEDAQKMYKKGTAVFVDVRSHEQYSLGHIKGAISIPGSQIVSRFRDIPAGKYIIAYCACSAEQSSGRAVLELNAHGVKNVAALHGGWNQWKATGLPMQAGPQ
ncbi:MAG TPA: rhodanese-like domain-containing protein [Thermoanaerobaculia bacterium]|nr:rhodanese-like domain-containing protein [Thermoanaerobaculia bacterium]